MRQRASPIEIAVVRSLRAFSDALVSIGLCSEGGRLSEVIEACIGNLAPEVASGRLAEFVADP